MAGIGFFAPLPLAMMMPFMAGQSMMMGDAFGKSYQYGKRKISAMSNEDFNKLTIRDLANDIQADFNNIIPPLSQAVRQSSVFQSLIIQEMGKIIKTLPAELTQFFTGEEASSNSLTAMLTVILSKMLNLPVQPFQQAFGEEPITTPIPTPTTTSPSSPDDDFIGPPAPPLSQEGLLKKYTDFATYRTKGGLLIQSQWNAARRRLIGLLPETEKILEEKQRSIPQGKIFHPSYFRQLKSLQNNRNAIFVKMKVQQKSVDTLQTRYDDLVRQRIHNDRFGRSILLSLQQNKRSLAQFQSQIDVIQNAMNEFVAKFKPNR